MVVIPPMPAGYHGPVLVEWGKPQVVSMTALVPDGRGGMVMEEGVGVASLTTDGKGEAQLASSGLTWVEATDGG